MSSAASETTPKPLSGTYNKVDKPIPEGYQLIEEGYAKVLYKGEREVFYNNAQVMNRDLSILALKTYSQMRKQEMEVIAQKRAAKKQAKGESATTTPAQQQQFPQPEYKGLKILEALSATGLRAIRYWKEIEGVDHIIANDLAADAVAAIKRNVEFNEVPEGCVIPNEADATQFMYLNRDISKQFDVVDLDPYGSASIFIDGAVQSVKDGGLMCVTCTDLGVLAGKNYGTCYAKYGAMPVPTPACHELALRIALASIQQAASRYKRYIVPILSVYMDFYIRMFVRVYESPGEVKRAFLKFSHVLQCSGCDAYHFLPVGKDQGGSHHTSLLQFDSKCTQCGNSMKIGGPVWNAPIHDTQFVQQCLQNLAQNKDKFTMEKRIHGMLTTVSQEVPEAPLFYDHPSLSAKLKMANPPFHLVRSAIMNAGYKISQSHCQPTAIKTTAPIDFLYDVYKSYNLKFNNNTTSKKQQKQAAEETATTTTEASAATEVKETSGAPEGKQGADKHKRTVKKGEGSVVARALHERSIKHEIDFTERAEAITGSKKTGVALFPINPAHWGPKRRANLKRARPENASTTNAEDEMEEVEETATTTEQQQEEPVPSPERKHRRS